MTDPTERRIKKMSDKQETDKNETRLPHLLNPHKIKIKKKQTIK